MASVKVSISFDTSETKRFRSPLLSLEASERFPLHGSGTRFICSPSKLRYVNVSIAGTGLPEVFESGQGKDNVVSLPSEDAISEGLIAKPHCFRRDVWRGWKGKISQARSKVARESKRKPTDPNLSSRGHRFTEDKEIEVELPYTSPELSIERCNDILKRLERRGNANTLGFFEWMRSHGKLKMNAAAYNLALRVLGGRDDWDAAEAMIREMSLDSACGLNFQVFNTMIYVCYKQGHVNLGAKWFRMMLEYGVQPNIATFGMLMNLYQKGWKLEEAEFAFGQMRDRGIKCELAYSAMITIYTRMSLFGKAEQIIKFLKEDEVTLNEDNWLVLLNAYCQQGKITDAEFAFFSMQEVGFSSSIVAYNTMITGYGKVSDMNAAQSIFCKLHKSGFEADETTYRSMIEGWGRANNYGETKRYFNELRRMGFKPNSSNLYTMINLEAKHEDEEGALRTINDMVMLGCQHSSILDNLLHAYERAGRINKVPLILGSSLYRHVLVNQTSCFVLLTFYVKHYLLDDALQVLRDKQWKDLVFEPDLYHLLICSCKEMGHLDGAVKLYCHIPKYLRLNLHIMCTMIDIYTDMGLFAEAESTYLKLKSSGFALDVVSFSVVAKMYAKAGLLEDACSVLETMDKEKGIVPDKLMFRDMLHIYQKSKKLDKLADLYYNILKSRVAWDQQMFESVIKCCARALPIDELSRLFDEMLRLGLVPDTTTFNVMIDAFGKSGFLRKAREVFWMARKRGLADVISYNTLIAAYGRSKDFRLMLSTIQIMEFSGFSVSVEAFNCMLDAYGKDRQLEKFHDVLKSMRESKCGSDNYTYNIMINIYGEQAWMKQVFWVFNEFKESGLGPDLCGYNTLIKAYGIAGMVEDAVSVIKEMRENDIEPNKVTYINLIAALRRNDKFFEAVKWSLWLKQMGL